MSDYTVNVVREIWNDKNGYRIVVGPDGDGLDLVQIQEINSDGVHSQAIVFCPDEAFLIAAALAACAQELKRDK